MADNFYSQAILAKVPNYTLTRSGRPLVVRQTFDAYYLEWHYTVDRVAGRAYISIGDLKIDGATPVIENGYFTDTDNTLGILQLSSRFPEPNDYYWGPGSVQVAGYGTAYYGPLSNDVITNIVSSYSGYSTCYFQLRVNLSSLPTTITWKTATSSLPGVNIRPSFWGCVDNADPAKRLYKQLAKLDNTSAGYDSGYYYQYSGLSLSMTVQ